MHHLIDVRCAFFLTLTHFYVTVFVAFATLTTITAQQHVIPLHSVQITCTFTTFPIIIYIICYLQIFLSPSSFFTCVATICICIHVTVSSHVRLVPDNVQSKRHLITVCTYRTTSFVYCSYYHYHDECI